MSFMYFRYDFINMEDACQSYCDNIKNFFTERPKVPSIYGYNFFVLTCIQAHDDIPKCLENCQDGRCQITNLCLSGTLSLSCPIWQYLGSSGCYLFFMVAMTTIWMPLSLHLWMVLNSG